MLMASLVGAAAIANSGCIEYIADMRATDGPLSTPSPPPHFRPILSLVLSFFEARH